MTRRLPIRLITTFWGESYCEEFLSYTAPALLAPGNLPVLAEMHDVEVVIVTQSHLFQRVRESSVGQRILKYCPLRLIGMDDLLGPPEWYGMVLTHAYFRGFSDIVSPPPGQVLMFLNSDFILADGCYRSLAKKLTDKPQVIAAPSYCVVSENVTPTLIEKRSSNASQISLGFREMAEICFQNMHPTIQSKTLSEAGINQLYMDQIYRRVDDTTLISRQMPISIVAISPTQIPPAPTIYWDYGITVMLSPGVTPSIIDDSDDFLMIELRGRESHKAGLSKRPVGVTRLARNLNRFLTGYQLTFVRHNLFLHSADLPGEETLQKASAEIDAYLDRVFKYLRKNQLPVSGHPMWNQQHAAYKHYLAVQHLHFPHRRMFVGPGMDISSEKQILLQINELIIRTALSNSVEFSTGPATPGKQLRSRIAEKILSLSYKIGVAPFGQEPFVSSLHPSGALLRPIVSQVSGSRDSDRILVVSNGNLHNLKSCSAADFSHISSYFVKLDLVDKTLPRHVSFDTVICELTYFDLHIFGTIYARLRQRVRDGGDMIFVFKCQGENLLERPVLERLLLALEDTDTGTLSIRCSKYLSTANQFHQRALKILTGTMGRRRSLFKIHKAAIFLLMTAILSLIEKAYQVQSTKREAGELCESATLTIRKVAKPTVAKRNLRAENVCRTSPITRR